MEAHLRELQAVGHTLVPDAIPPQLLGRLQSAFQRRVEATQQREPRGRWLQHSDPGGRGENPHCVVDLVRVCEEEPDLEALLDLPPAYDIARAAMAQGRGAAPGTMRLFTGPICHHLPPQTPGPAQPAYHNDGDYLRLTFVLRDLPPGGGGTAYLPASHHVGELGAVSSSADSLTGPVAGGPEALVAKAGDCWVNWTTLWHSRAANTSRSPRQLVWQVYRRATQATSERAHGLLSREYVEAGMAGLRGWSEERKALVGKDAWRPGAGVEPSVGETALRPSM